MTDKTLTDVDIRDAATALDVEVAAVKAILDVEAAGRGFLDNGQVKLLFEAHHFSRLTDGRFDASHPDISSPTWNRDLYVGGAGEHERLQRALELDAKAALQSASYGLGQIMGFNHDLAGFRHVEEFYNDQKHSERRHLMALVRYIKARGLDGYLQDRDWAGFAERYNGPGYAEHDYDGRLARAYAAHQAGIADLPTLRRGSQGAAVQALQRALSLRPIDGIFGPGTLDAVRTWQYTQDDLQPDGVVGPRTWAALAETHDLDLAAA